MGEVTLNRQQALHFVRTRKDVGNQLNLSRMERHKEYLLGLTAALGEKLHTSESFTVEIYEEMSPYMVTDCSVNAISGLLQRCADYTLKGIVSVEGENKLGEEFYEFYADAEKLDALILQLFYAPKN
jgi:anionic cell wall polymer biosynthesis LytR-Cps2A-Psr (LCP) family protein